LRNLKDKHAKEKSMDRYTKFLLTVIAVALIWISLHLGAVIPVSYAGLEDAKIEIADITVSRGRPLPVYVTGELKCE
jgi:hypothetical protein